MRFKRIAAYALGRTQETDSRSDHSQWDAPSTSLQPAQQLDECLTTGLCQEAVSLSVSRHEAKADLLDRLLRHGDHLRAPRVGYR